MRLNQLANETGVSVDTVRYYTRIGFLKPTKNPSNGYKEYCAKEKRRMRFILSARQLGFSVSDIAEILETADQGESPCPLARGLIQKRLEENEKGFQDSQRLRQRMYSAVRDWETKPDRAPTGNMICHLIEEFSESGEDKRSV